MHVCADQMFGILMAELGGNDRPQSPPSAANFL